MRNLFKILKTKDIGSIGIGAMIVYIAMVLVAGIAASGGSACHSGDESISYVLKSIGCDLERTSVRFSFSRYNTINDIETCVRKIVEILYG